MSTQFQPLEIPPGVVATPTKKMRSSNWSEVNLVRWREGQLTPMGGQAQLSNLVGGVERYAFASRCKAIHGWFGLDGSYHIAYLCEANLYVDTGGTLTEITPTGGIVAPSGLVGGYGDGLYARRRSTARRARSPARSPSPRSPTPTASIISARSSTR